MTSDSTVATEVAADTAVGRLRSVVLDCPEPRELAKFYAALLGGVVIDEEDEDDTWVVVVDPDGRRLAFQTAPRYKPPRFPDPEASQQIHLDILVDDIDVAETKALALGARPVQASDDDRFRVYADPVGHPFCLVWSHGR
ncbi:VOC family protein [Nocardia sp. NPDC050713]|uniref:VOC family protein n=1 Tax=unclassified Nocardia TaxID=2637762 RepID=UPI0033B68461